MRPLMTAIWLLLSVASMDMWAYDVIVADSATRTPLPNASIYDKNGSPAGLSSNKGALPKIARSHYPITIRYLGFNDRTVDFGERDTIFLSEIASELPEVVVKPDKHRLLHILAYVREYSTLATYTDTIYLFREKMVDYMLPPNNKLTPKGWSSPRILTCRSYYRFTNNEGLDSVSDACPHHFSWSDWVGLPPKVSIPLRIKTAQAFSDTLRGKYTPTEIWRRDNDRLTVDVDVLADTASRKWIPNLAAFFRRDLDFGKIRLGFRFDNSVRDSVSRYNLDGYSISIESTGRGRDMFRFNKLNQQFCVSTDADIYILDKEYITAKEARRWEKRNFDVDEIGIYEPMDAPPLSAATLELIDRVNLVDKEKIRLSLEPDKALMAKYDGRRNFRIGRRALLLFKQLLPIKKK